jgi:all-trans-retinol 13,14-reductase
MSKSAIIIGGGLGGLVSGCLLVKEGYEVTVLEKHSIIGGGLHCFERNGKLFETGIHYISGFQEGGVLRRIFEYIEVFEGLEFVNLDHDGFDLVHVGEDNSIFKMGAGKENFVKKLSESFPLEKENIIKFIDAVYSICDDIPLYNLRANESSTLYINETYLSPIGEYISSFINDEKLQKIIAWNNGLYAGEKETTPTYIYALILKFYLESPTRFAGGSQQLADAMKKMIESNGGKVLANNEVTKIDVKNKSIQKVMTSDGIEYKADVYISDIHPAMLMDMIDPQEIQRSFRERLKGLENTYSVFTIYAIFKPESFPYLNYNYYYFKNYDAIWNGINFNIEEEIPGFLLLTPPEKEKSEFADKMIVNCIMKFETFKKWENTKLRKRGTDYYSFKKMIENKIIDEVEKVFPNVRSAISHIDSATPLTLRDYLGSKDGSLYGYKKESRSIIQSQLLPRTKIDNLFLTGQNLNLHGIMGVPLSSISTVGALVGTDYLIEKINNHKNISK